jgi:hypothetical protein
MCPLLVDELEPVEEVDPLPPEFDPFEDDGVPVDEPDPEPDETLTVGGVGGAVPSVGTAGAATGAGIGGGGGAMSVTTGALARALASPLTAPLAGLAPDRFGEPRSE